MAAPTGREITQTVEDAPFGEDLHGPRVEDRGAGLGGRPGQLLQYDGPGAAAHLTREQQPDGPGTDDEDVGVR